MKDYEVDNFRAKLAKRDAEVKRLGELLVDRDKYIHDLRVDFGQQLKTERDAAYVRGLERAIEVIDGLPDGIDCSNAIQAEIDKAGK